MSYVTSRFHLLRDDYSDEYESEECSGSSPTLSQEIISKTSSQGPFESQSLTAISNSFFEPTKQNSSSLADQEKEYSEIEKILPPPPEIEDEVTRKIVFERNKKLVLKRLDKLSKFLADNEVMFSDYSLPQLYIAFEMSNFDIDSLFHRLTVQDSQYLSKNFLKEEVHARCGGKKTRSESHSSIDSIKATSGWRKKEIKEFINFCSVRKDKVYLSDIMLCFPNHNESRCLALYNYLYDEGTLTIPITTKKHCTLSNANSITSLTFVKGITEYHVGHAQSIFDRYKLLNPIPDFIDQVTFQRMEIPALSQDGYVLDYYTWLKIIQDEKCNPFTRNPITSKRSLTILTVDNIDFYRPKIINWDSCKPDDYEEKR